MHITAQRALGSDTLSIATLQHCIYCRQKRLDIFNSKYLRILQAAINLTSSEGFAFIEVPQSPFFLNKIDL